MRSLAILFLCTAVARGSFFGSPAIPRTTTPAVKVPGVDHSVRPAGIQSAQPDKQPRFRLPKIPNHLVLPVLSYSSLAATTAGTLMVLRPLAWQGVALTGWCVGAPFAVVLAQLATMGGSGVAKAMGGEATQDQRLMKLAAEAAAAVGVQPPTVFEIKSREPNAFATSSLFAKDPTVAVTTGLRQVLTEEELGAVLAHEMGHLRHRDVLRNMHVAAAAAGLGGIYDVGRMLLDSSSRRSKKKSSKKDDEGGAEALGLSLMAAGLVTQTAAHGLRLMASRNAELKADRAAAEAYGAGTMIRALQKINEASARRPADLRKSKDGRAFAFAMISDGPSTTESGKNGRRGDGGGTLGAIGRAFGRLGDAMRTHPTLDKRVHALEAAAEAGLVPRELPAASRWGWS